MLIYVRCFVNDIKLNFIIIVIIKLLLLLLLLLLLTPVLNSQRRKTLCYAHQTKDKLLLNKTVVW